MNHQEELAHSSGELWDEREVELCDECAHPVALHNDKYGCQYERGDSWVTGAANQVTCLMAMGPCGCKAIALEQFPATEQDGEYTAATAVVAEAAQDSDSSTHVNLPSTPEEN